MVRHRLSTPFTVVLTGGICSGKSTVSEIFTKLAVTIIDADKIAKQLVIPNACGWLAIKKTWGTRYFLEDETLNREKLRSEFFSDPDIKNQLESILHPLIRDEIIRQQALVTSSYVILDIPLFAENHQRYTCHRVLVVDAPETLQLERLMQRDHCTHSQALAIIHAQAKREDRLALADDVVTNTSSKQGLANKIALLHQKYLQFSQSC